MKKIVVFLILLINFLTFSVCAIDISAIQEQIVPNSELQNLVTGSALDILGDITINNSTDFANEFQGIIGRCKVYVNEVFAKTTTIMVEILIILIISSIASGFCTANEINSVNSYINMATALSVSSVILLDVRSVLTLCMQSIAEIDILSKGLMPTMVTAISVSGAPTTAAIHYAATMFAFDLIITLINRVMFPFTYIYISIITVNAAISSEILLKLADFIKWSVNGSLKIIVTAFITYISISGAVSGKADIFAIKTTKLVVSSAIPVVGSIISDASESILVGASVIKNSIGIFGIFAVISICLIPIIYILANFFAFKIMAVIVSIISSKNIINLLDGISSSFNMALAMICSSASILFIMMVVSIILVGDV
ncbi:MAG: hypothetical protein R3Y09_08015 [Clostridia bacterium]